MTDAMKARESANAAYARGDYAAAAAGYKNALALDPGDADLLAIYARASGAAGDLEEALRAAQHLLGWRPDHKMALATGCGAAFALSRWRVAAELGALWLRHRELDDPAEKVRAARMTAQALLELGNARDAQSVYRAVVEIEPQNPEHWSSYARLCLGALDYRGAEEAIEKAHAIAAPTAATLFTRARMEYFFGRMEKAASQCARAIEADPGFAPAFTLLTAIREGAVSDARLEGMKALENDSRTPPGHRASLAFAVGDALQQRERFDDALAAYKRANAVARENLIAQELGYDGEAVREEFDQAAAAFAALPDPLETVAGPQPIFVVGMPRSGTTLIESLLAAHEDVDGAGELQAMRAIHQEIVAWSSTKGAAHLSQLPRDALARARDWYRQALPASTARFIVDKQPLNFRSAPLIKTLFPNSPIIHVRRNALDAAFSIYRLDFAKTWPFSASFEDIADFYGHYAQWARAHLDHGDLFQYEELVADFEGEARRLFAHCGLEWRAEALRFHEQARPIATFSAAQVRAPMRARARHARDRYGDGLEPLAQALRRAGVDLETGAASAA